MGSVLFPAFVTVVASPSGMNEGLPGAEGAAGGKLLEGPAVSPHRMALEMGQDEHGVVIEDVFADGVGLKRLPAFDRPNDVWHLGIHQIDFEVFVLAVLLKKLKVGLGVVPDASAGVPIGVVALNDGPVDVIDHRLPKLGMEVVLVALRVVFCHAAFSFLSKRKDRSLHLGNLALPR